MLTPALHHLMGAYFHQDFDVHGTEEQVVAAFIAGSPGLWAALPDEIDTLLQNTADEAELQRAVDELGGEYYPIPRYGSYRAWLVAVADQARAASRV